MVASKLFPGARAAQAAALPAGTPAPACTHADQICDVTPSAAGCEQCLRLGERWVHLRMCLHCGRVGCCDSSKNKHATQHFYATGHPVIRSIEPGESWRWCFVDQVLLEPPGGAR